MSQVQQVRQRSGRTTIAVQDWDEKFLHRLKEGLPEFLRLDVAESTGRAYAWHERQWEQLFAGYGKAPAADPDMLARFVVGRACHGYSLSTIEVGIAAVARWAMLQGCEGLATHLVVKRALRVAARIAVPAGVQQKLPLSRHDLSEVVGMFSSQPGFIACRDTALFLVGWVGMFRSSELATMDWQDVHFSSTRSGVMIYMPRSKTDQAGEGAWVFLAACTSDLQLCPVRALCRLAALTNAEGPVFAATPSAGRPMSKTTVGVRLKKALAAAGVAGADKYAAHSLRRGGATYACHKGIPLRMVMMMGRWRSDVVRQYLYCAPTHMWEASRRMQM